MSNANFKRTKLKSFCEGQVKCQNCILALTTCTKSKNYLNPYDYTDQEIDFLYDLAAQKATAMHYEQPNADAKNAVSTNISNISVTEPNTHLSTEEIQNTVVASWDNVINLLTSQANQSQRIAKALNQAFGTLDIMQMTLLHTPQEVKEVIVASVAEPEFGDVVSCLDHGYGIFLGKLNDTYTILLQEKFMIGLHRDQFTITSYNVANQIDDMFKIIGIV